MLTGNAPRARRRESFLEVVADIYGYHVAHHSQMHSTTYRTFVDLYTCDPKREELAKIVYLEWCLVDCLLPEVPRFRMNPSLGCYVQVEQLDILEKETAP